MFLSRRQKIYEDYGYILDYPIHRRMVRKPALGDVAQLIGERVFLLLEAVVKPNVSLEIGERVFIGRDGRDKILYILGLIEYGDLTDVAKSELESVVENIVRINEKRFVEFFNSSTPVSPRMHALELIPGIGKKYMWIILRERESNPFKSFSDIQQRTGIPDPAKLIARRIVEEVSNPEVKYRLFTVKIAKYGVEQP
jgi:putative nucleotide binding protein